MTDKPDLSNALKTYTVVSKCKATAKCKGMLDFGVVNVESLSVLTERLRSQRTQTASCPICQKDAEYTFRDYLASPLAVC
jgi:hypothetical protein